MIEWRNPWSETTTCCKKHAIKRIDENDKMKLYKLIIGVFGCIIIGFLLLNLKYKVFALNKQISYIDTTFSIMTFNVDALDSASFTKDKQERLLNLIQKEHPDILCMQELTYENLKKIKPQLDSIYGPCYTLKGDDQQWRLRFYSQFPLRNFRKYDVSEKVDTTGFDDDLKKYYSNALIQMPVMSAEFEVTSGHWVTVFSGHLRSSAYSTARRSMDKDASWMDGLSLYWRNYNVGKRIRDYEAENVRRFIDEARTSTSSGTTPVIVAGDLNDWCGSDCLETLMGTSKGFNWFQKVSEGFNGELKDAWWEGGNGFGWTYFGWNLRLRLDHILYSDELELVDVEVINSDISDHKPLMAKFRVK